MRVDKVKKKIKSNEENVFLESPIKAWMASKTILLWLD